MQLCPCQTQLIFHYTPMKLFFWGGGILKLCLSVWNIFLFPLAKCGSYCFLTFRSKVQIIVELIVESLSRPYILSPLHNLTRTSATKCLQVITALKVNKDQGLIDIYMYRKNPCLDYIFYPCHNLVHNLLKDYLRGEQ